MRILHGELAALQEWVKASGAKVCIVFEGRDTAGKGGTIKADHRAREPPGIPWSPPCRPRRRAKNRRCTSSATSRTFRPAGEVVIFDRSWYNRAGVERSWASAPRSRPSGSWSRCQPWRRPWSTPASILIKYWLEVSSEEQTRRLESRINDPRKVWKLSELDLKSYSRWYDYSRARDAMFAATDSAWAPWFIAKTDNKKRARLNIIHHLLSQIPTEPLAHSDVKLPQRQRRSGYVEPALAVRQIPTPF